MLRRELVITNNADYLRESLQGASIFKTNYLLSAWVTFSSSSLFLLSISSILPRKWSRSCSLKKSSFTIARDSVRISSTVFWESRTPSFLLWKSKISYSAGIHFVVVHVDRMGDKPRRADSFFYSRKPASKHSMQWYREKSRAFGTRDPPLLHARLTLLNTRNEELARRLYARTHSFPPIRQMTKSPGKIMWSLIRNKQRERIRSKTTWVSIEIIAIAGADWASNINRELWRSSPVKLTSDVTFHALVPVYLNGSFLITTIV